MKWRDRAEQARLTRAYQSTFTGEEGRLVLADLAIQCRGTSSSVEETGQLDLGRLAFEEGKRWAWLRIANFLAMDQAEIANLLRQLRPAIRAEIEQQAAMARSDR